MKVFRYADDIIWSLPLFCVDEHIYYALYDVLKRRNRKITIGVNMFGAPRTAWSSGRPCPKLNSDHALETLRYAIEDIRGHGAYPTFTFTNNMIDENILMDRYANDILDLALSYDCRFIVTSDLLREHIRSKKSDACIIASVILPAIEFQGENRKKVKNIEEAESEYYNKLLKLYDVVVVRPEYSLKVLVNHPEYIDDIKRVEVLINQTCVPNCPKMPSHYHFFDQLNVGLVSEGTHFTCIKTYMDEKDKLDFPLTHTGQIINKLVENGVRRLKIQGRSMGLHPLTMLDIIAHQILEDTPENACAYLDAVRYLQRSIKR